MTRADWGLGKDARRRTHEEKRNGKAARGTRKYPSARGGEGVCGEGGPTVPAPPVLLVPLSAVRLEGEIRRHAVHKVTMTPISAADGCR